jgi:hypothetical protein
MTLTLLERPRLPSRQPVVRERRTALGARAHELQVERGLYTVERGEPFALPVDRLDEPRRYLGRDFWRHDAEARTFRKGVRFLPHGTDWQTRLKRWGNAHVSRDFSYRWNLLAMGHDVQVSMRGDLFGRHQHRGWADPFTGYVAPPLDPTFETAPWHAAHLPKLAHSGHDGRQTSA